IAEQTDGDLLAAHLVQEFLDMLSEEGLVPVKPLVDDELTDAWVRSEMVIVRYHDFFRACVDAIADALGAETDLHRESSAPGYIWRGFKTKGGEFTAVGLNSSDIGL